MAAADRGLCLHHSEFVRVLLGARIIPQTSTFATTRSRLVACCNRLTWRLSVHETRTYNPSVMAIIEIEDLAKSYRVYQKKEGLLASHAGAVSSRIPRRRRRCAASTLQVEQGEFVAFLGPNGAGKTTTLKLLSGVITPTGGTARVMGHVPWKRENAYRRRFALVMGQKNQLWWDLPAAGVVSAASADLPHRARPSSSGRATS